MTTRFPTKKVRNIAFPPPPAFAESNSCPDPDIARLMLNEAPFEPSPRATAAATASLVHANRYPDQGCTELVSEISARTGVDINRIVVGNGSVEVLVALAMLALEEGDEAIVPAPTFPACLKGIQIAGGNRIDVPVRPDGANDVPAMLTALSDRTRLFYLCTPNNPTGNILSASELVETAREVPDDCLLVIDEAYCEFAMREGGPDILDILATRRGQWAITRSFSKAYCLAGLRVGYALVSDGDISDGLKMLHASFNVNRAAQAAAVAAMRDDDHMQGILTQTIEERTRLCAALQQRGCSVLPSFANFLTARLPCPAKPVAQTLAEDGIVTQYLPWPNADGALRITVGSRPETDRLISMLDNILGAV